MQNSRFEILTTHHIRNHLGSSGLQITGNKLELLITGLKFNIRHRSFCAGWQSESVDFTYNCGTKSHVTRDNLYRDIVQYCAVSGHTSNMRLLKWYIGSA